MVIKMFISGISASKEVKKHQLRAQFLLDSYKIKYETVDITDPNTEELKEKMFSEAKRRNESSPPLPPQFFNEDKYCGDFEDLENANDNHELFSFLGLEEDIAIENGFGKGDDEDYDFSGLLNKSKDDKKSEENGKDEKVEEDDAEVEEEVVEQVTINGVVYIIPPDRKITVGGRVIDVDELLQAQGEEVDLDEVDENLKKKLEKDEDNKNEDAGEVDNDKTNEDTAQNTEAKDDENKEDNKENKPDEANAEDKDKEDKEDEDDEDDTEE